MSALSQGGVRYTSYRFPGFVLLVWYRPIARRSHLKTVFDEDLFVVVPGHDDTQPIDDLVFRYFRLLLRLWVIRQAAVVLVPMPQSFVLKNDLLPRHFAESLMQHERLFYFFPNTCHDT